MSERGSFATNFIYDREVARIVLDFFSALEPEDGVEITVTSIGPVVCGIITCNPGYSEQEQVKMEYTILPELAKMIKDPIIVAVIADSGRSIFYTVGNDEVVAMMSGKRV